MTVMACVAECINYPTRNAESEARGVRQPKKVLRKDFTTSD
jgi:hypothetical protein